MDVTTVSKLVPVLQTAIGPVILISGIGLVLLTMTNRLGRIVDRSRIMVAELAEASEADNLKIHKELDILWRRARYIRLAIGLVSTSALASAILVIALFVTVWWQLEGSVVIGGLFITSMACLIGALIAFLQDIQLSLEALKLELSASDIDTA